MGEEAECEFARFRATTDTGSEGDRVPAVRRRTTLHTSDGVRIEAAYEPYAGGGGEADGSPAPGAIVLAHGFSGSVDRPALRRAAQVFAQYGAVITFSFRGHGGSGGHSTVGDREVLDLAAVVRWARSAGHERVATVGFSMGGSVVVRHGALYRPRTAGAGDRAYTEAHEGRTVARSGEPSPAEPALVSPDAVEESGAHSDTVVAVSAPARWYYRGTAPMRRLHWAIQRPVGRLVCRYGLRTRIHPRDWDPVPLSPVAAVPALAPTPLLVVHGDQDPYFPLDHPHSLADAADPGSTDLWIVPGFGHAENAADPELLHRIGTWISARWRSAAERPA